MIKKKQFSTESVRIAERKGNMKKIIALCLCLIAVVSAVSGCSANTEKDNGKINIVTTIFPLYEWTKNIAGDKADVTLLVDNGVDLHSFQPSAEDIVKISTCDMFVYVGGESDSWVDDALKEKVNKDMAVVNLLELLKNDIKEEETVEGMQEEKEKEDEKEYDEHIWLSLRNARKCCDGICKELVSADKKNKTSYEKNNKDYSDKLSNLDNEYKTAVNSAKTKTVVFGDRFPFRYLADDYDIKYYAAFAGCSAETEASFKTIAFLADKVDEYKLNAIFKIETSDDKIAKTIRENTKSKNQKILTLDSMQNKTAKDIKNKITYLSVMQNNLNTLKEGLN